MSNIKINDGLSGVMGMYFMNRGIQNFGQGELETYLGLAEMILAAIILYPFIRQFLKEN